MFDGNVLMRKKKNELNIYENVDGISYFNYNL